MPLLQTTTGFETLPAGSAKVYAFTMPSRLFPGKEENLTLACRNPASRVSSVGQTTKVLAMNGAPREMGEWSTRAFDLPEGMLIKVFVNRSAASFGQMRIMANIILRMRARAALRRVSINLTGHSRANLSRANFEGRFDVLTPSEAEALGAVLTLNFLPTFDMERVQSACSIETIEPEQEAPVVVQTRRVENAAGEVRQVAVAVRRRALDL